MPYKFRCTVKYYTENVHGVSYIGWKVEARERVQTSSVSYSVLFFLVLVSLLVLHLSLAFPVTFEPRQAMCRGGCGVDPHE